MNDEVKAWLKRSGHSRQWLADQCGVSIGTVNNWLSAGRKITGSPAKIIEQLMSGVPEINPRLDLKTFEKFQAKARSEGKTVDELIAELIKNAIKLLIFAAIITAVFLTSADVEKWTAELSKVLDTEPVATEGSRDIFWGE
jgi:transcriptional regulator with XRE-family HTH domain